jgi:hypothetical protein
VPATVGLPAQVVHNPARILRFAEAQVQEELLHHNFLSELALTGSRVNGVNATATKAAFKGETLLAPR